MASSCYILDRNMEWKQFSNASGGSLITQLLSRSNSVRVDNECLAKLKKGGLMVVVD